MPTAAAAALVGRYEIGAIIGSGGMGTVLRARDTLNDEIVAIKQLRSEAIVRDPTLLERFAREHAALRTLNHPNIVRVIEAFEHAGDQYLVMEFVSGGSLDVRLQAGNDPLALDYVLRVALDLADALTRVHRLDIVHRDIKPSNVLLAPDGTPRLSDFGVAQQAGYESLTGPSAIVGTLDYLCPEALTGQRLDAGADLWGMGALLFEMLTQRRPFGGDHPAAVLHAIVSSPPLDLESLCPDCPPELIDLTYRLLEKDPAQRVPSARQLGVELERIFQGLRQHPGSSRAQQSRGSHNGGASDTAVKQDDVGRPLPHELTPFIGRDAEVRAITRLLASPETRLVTIRGPGGMGKSRLAREVGRQLALGGADASDPRALLRVEWVELASLDSAELIVPAIAGVLGLMFAPGTPPQEQLLRYLAPRRLVLILDNFEHLLSGAGLLSEIQTTAPGVQILATSRELLGLSSEHLIDLRGMTGTQLFFACARRARPDFEPTPDRRLAVARVCELVSGMPLGITLAAAWVNVLEPAEIAEEIARSFEFLEVELKDLPQRHHSVRAVFEHSWKLLTVEERRVFAALSVFRGGFTRSAAQAVTHASLRTLAALLNKSLIERDPTSGRYGMHELVRQYAAGQLAGDSEIEARMLDEQSAYFTELLGGMQERLIGASSAAASEELDLDVDNVRAAWARAVQRRSLAQLGRAIEGLDLYYSLNGYFAEAASVFGAAARALSGVQPARGSELARLSALSWILEASAYHSQWLDTEALPPATRALELLDERHQPREFALGLFTLATSSYWSALASGEPTGTLEAAEQALQLYRATDDWWGTACALNTFGALVDPIRGEACFRESVALQRSHGDRSIALPGSVMGLGIIKQEQGDRVEGRVLLLEALSVAEQRRDISAQGFVLERLGILELKDGNVEAAEAYASQRLALCREFMPFAELACQVNLGQLLLVKGLLAEAEQCFLRGLGSSESCLSARSGAITVALADRGLGDVDTRRGRYSSARLRLTSSLLYFEQKQIPWGVVFATDSLGWAECCGGELEQAAVLFHKALRIAMEWHWTPWALGALAGHAWVLYKLKQVERAVEIAALVQTHPATEHSTRVERTTPLLRALENALPRSVFERSVERGRGLELGALARVVLETPFPTGPGAEA
jgi:predicted ATPase